MPIDRSRRGGDGLWYDGLPHFQGNGIKLTRIVILGNPGAESLHLYRHRHLVENAFLPLKRWRGIARRYATNLSSFLAAAAQIRCLVL